MEHKQNDEGVLTMHIDGSISKEGAGSSIWIISPNRDSKVYYFKLTFERTNNVVEYEALLLGLNSLKELKEKWIYVFGDSELVVNQVNGSYQTKQPRMRAYRNDVWDMFGNFFTEHRVMVIPIIQYQIVYSVAINARIFRVPIYSNKKYEIEVVNRPSIADNSKYWKIFEDYLQIKIFLEMSDEFLNTNIDVENQNSENTQDDE